VKISVIIPVYNREHTIARALDSAIVQRYQADEIIVVDDGSEDGTLTIINGYKEVQIIKHEKNIGVAAARNTGIRAARNEWIAFLDSDDVWKPSKLQNNLHYHRSNQRFRIFQNEESWIRNGRYVNPKKKHLKQEGWIFQHCLPLCIISPSAVVIHKTVFEKVGLFDETFPVCEDYDLWLRIAPHYEVGLDPSKTTVKYGGHADQLSHSYEAMDLWRIRAMTKHLESGDLTEINALALRQELMTKLKIYISGANKRNKNVNRERALLEKLDCDSI